MLVRRLRLLQVAGCLLAVGVAAVTGCSSSSPNVAPVTHPTMIRVEPEDFEGAVTCTQSGPGFKVYVATIVDRNFGEGGAPGSTVTNDAGAPEGGADGFRAPSSDPTPCTTGVGFGFVVPDRHYEVFIDGYDRDDLVARAPGSPELVPSDAADPVQASVVTPRWRAKCMNAVAVDSTIVRADGCSPFRLDDAAASTGSVRIALGTLLGDLRCGSKPGQVARFDVVATTSQGSQTRTSVKCSSRAQVTFVALASGEKPSYYVQAMSADGASAIAGAECYALVKPEVSTDAQCAALSPVGTLRVDLASALKTLGGTCRADVVADVAVSLPDEDSPRHFPPPDCSQPFDRGFPPGTATVTLSASFLEAPTTRTLTCEANVEPGRLVTATCSQN